MLNTCPFAEQKWRQMQGVFEIMDKYHHNIKETILLWGSNILSSLIVNRLLVIALGLNLWAIWNDRYHKVFKNKVVSL